MAKILVSVHSELAVVCLSVCPRFPIRVKSTMADNLIERATWPVDLSRCRPISMAWEFVTQYDGNWGDVPRLSHLCTSFLERHFLCFIFFFPLLLCNTTIFMAVPWESKSLRHTKCEHGVPAPSTPRSPTGRTESLSHFITSQSVLSVAVYNQNISNYQWRFKRRIIEINRQIKKICIF